MEKLILSEDEIIRICKDLGKQLDEYLKDKEEIPVFLGIMNGALPFLYELVKHVTHPLIIDTLQVSSYQGEESSGKVTLLKEPDHDLENQIVIIVEDIIDTGVTMHYLKEMIKEKYKPKEIKICILIKRNNIKMQFDETSDFIGIKTDEQKYLVGFGFDYQNLFRNIPYIFVPSIKDVKSWEPLFNHKPKKK